VFNTGLLLSSNKKISESEPPDMFTIILRTELYASLFSYMYSALSFHRYGQYKLPSNFHMDLFVVCVSHPTFGKFLISLRHCLSLWCTVVLFLILCQIESQIIEYICNSLSTTTVFHLTLIVVQCSSKIIIKDYACNSISIWFL
jgi:hypothetical protein